MNCIGDRAASETNTQVVLPSRTVMPLSNPIDFQVISLAALVGSLPYMELAKSQGGDWKEWGSNCTKTHLPLVTAGR